MIIYMNLTENAKIPEDLYQYIIFPFLSLDNIYKLEDALHIKYKNLEIDCINRINKKLNQMGYNPEFTNKVYQNEYKIGGEFILHCLVDPKLYKPKIIIYYPRKCPIGCYCLANHKKILQGIYIPIFRDSTILKHISKNKLHIIYKDPYISYPNLLKTYYQRLNCGIGFNHSQLIETLANTYNGRNLSIYNRKAIRDHSILKQLHDPIMLNCTPKKRRCYNSHTGQYFTHIKQCNKCDNCRHKQTWELIISKVYSKLKYYKERLFNLQYN